MDPSIPHHARKIRLDLTSSPTTRRSDSVIPPPPAYTTYPQNVDTQNTPNGQSWTDDESTPVDLIEGEPHRIILDSTTTIQGSSNVVQLETAANAARLAVVITSLLRDSRWGIANHTQQPHPNAESDPTMIQRPIHLTVDCGVKVMGHQNSVSDKPLKIFYVPTDGSQTIPSAPCGNKRKADEAHIRAESAAKRQSTSQAPSPATPREHDHVANPTLNDRPRNQETGDETPNSGRNLT